MTNVKTIATIINNLRGYQKKLAILAGYSKDEFTRDFTKVESAKHLLQVSIEYCLDLAHHLIANEGYRTPQNSYDSFVVLSEVGLIPHDFLPTLRQMTSFRNRVVHLYWDVDDETVYEIVQQNLIDFDAYMRYILEFIK